MGEADMTLAETVRALAKAQDLGSHPSSETLLAYHGGELSEKERSGLHAHLAWCPGCAQTILDMTAFPNIEVRAESLERTPEEEAADWQAIQERLRADETDVSTDSAAPPAARPRKARRRISYTPLHALAASLVLAVLGLSFWVLQLKQQVTELDQVQVNVFVSDLEAVGGEASRDVGTVATIAVPPGMDRVVLLLSYTGFQPFDDFEVEILDARGSLLWSHGGLARTPEGSFSVEISKSRLPTGRYEIRLYGSEGEDKKPLASYRTHIEYESSD